MTRLIAKGISLRYIFLTLPLVTLLTIWGYKEIRGLFVQPEAILVLGGSTAKLERERFTAKFAREHPNLPIIISGGGDGVEQVTRKVFQKQGVENKRIEFDKEASDTVANFTTTVDKLHKRGIKSVYLITSDFHMRRASVIAEIVLGSRGIDFKPVAVPSKQSKPEPVEKAVRDGFRSIVWLATGFTVEKNASNPQKIEVRKQ